MANGTFYLLDSLPADQWLTFYCERIAEAWRQHRSVRVWCEDKEQALALDEQLWQHPADAFVPHNLLGEGPPGGAPVEICWPNADTIKPRRVAAHLVLTATVPAQLQGARQIIDRVPVAEADKQSARERYKAYRQMGFQLTTTAASTQTSAEQPQAN